MKTSDMVAGLEMVALTVTVYWLAWWAVRDLHTFQYLWRLLLNT